MYTLPYLVTTLNLEVPEFRGQLRRAPELQLPKAPGAGGNPDSDKAINSHSLVILA